MDRARPRAPKSFTPAERAEILEAATRFGATRAAKQFGCSPKAIERWKRAAAEGSDAELAKSVAERAASDVERTGSLFDATWEKTLLELQRRLPNMKDAEVLRTAEMMGDLALKRDLLTDGETEPSGVPGRGEAAAQAQGRGSTDTGRSPATPPAVH
jgi:transposase-like protein